MDGTPGFVLPDDDEPEAGVAPWCALLPGLDVTTMGWFDRDWYLGEHRGQVFDRNGNAGPTVWWTAASSGLASGRRRARRAAAARERRPRAPLGSWRQRADELTEWLDGVRISPRFPSPLSKG